MSTEEKISIAVIGAMFSCDKCKGITVLRGKDCTINTCICGNIPIKIPKLTGRKKEIFENIFIEMLEYRLGCFTETEQEFEEMYELLENIREIFI